MPRVIQAEERKKRWAAKVRTGCLTCRGESVTTHGAVPRRVKCDETRPNCDKCTGAGKTCRYHNETASGYRFRNILPRSTAAVVPLPLAPEESPYARCSGPGNESRYLQFFMEKTIPDFLLMFPESTWRTRVLQVAHTEPSIRHALISLASSHEWRLDAGNRRSPNRESDLSSRHYSLALSCLQSDLTVRQQHRRQSLHINVCSCLLFMCREGLYGRRASSMRLFHCGRKMIREYRSNKEALNNGDASIEADIEPMISSLEDIFRRVEVQLSNIIGGLDPEFLFGHDGAFEPRCVPIDGPFSSLEDAQDAILHAHACITADVLRGQVANHVHNAHVGSWSRSFEALLSRPQNSPDKRTFERTVAVLELMKRHIGVVMLGWETQEEGYTEMVMLAKRALGLETVAGRVPDGASKSDKAHDNDREEDERRQYCQATDPDFDFIVGIVPALFAIFMRCSNSLRREVADIFHRVRLAEGIWCAKIVGRVLDRILELEKDSNASEEPGSFAGGRIEQAKIHFEDGSGEDAVVEYSSAQATLFEAMIA
ncbi:hypothetical protein LMH87_002987 [Akanthomyces muscarius]|uniref:Zn(2)-C6 fungal-type domain-containing protein n=1 Tax=Akanthomyces muscarius TaxID=2231603 RepID=A0A9W8UJU5_AKAMU|nr:hypothetical protein LMH87_002987 [Akanthomyces muscarius]KAJ4148522.1 hypothetical protein LMH87_002987 [Akanthomyces muscarius]